MTSSRAGMKLLLVTFGFLIIIVLGVTANIIREQVRWDREHP